MKIWRLLICTQHKKKDLIENITIYFTSEVKANKYKEYHTAEMAKEAFYYDLPVEKSNYYITEIEVL